MARLLRFALWQFALSFLLVACGGEPVPSTRLNGSVGTWNYGGTEPGLAFAIAGFLDELHYGSARVSVVTPNGSVIQAAMEKERWAPGPVLGWWFFSTPPLPGTYRLEASLPGNLYLSKEMPLNPENLLPLVANPSLIFDQSQMVVRWQPSSGARSYYVELWEVDTEGNLTSQYPLLYTTGLELHFVTVDLGLQPGKRYQARVFAYSADLTDRLHLPDALSSPFNISSTWTEARVLAP